MKCHYHAKRMNMNLQNAFKFFENFMGLVVKTWNLVPVVAKKKIVSKHKTSFWKEYETSWVTKHLNFRSQTIGLVSF